MSLRQVLLIFVLFPFTESDLGPFKILKEWPKPVYDTKCLKNPDKVYYRSTKNQISGIKIFRNKVYLSIPREEDGVPVTLGRVPLYAGKFFRKNSFTTNAHVIGNKFYLKDTKALRSNLFHRGNFKKTTTTARIFRPWPGSKSMPQEKCG